MLLNVAPIPIEMNCQDCGATDIKSIGNPLLRQVAIMQQITNLVNLALRQLGQRCCLTAKGIRSPLAMAVGDITSLRRHEQVLRPDTGRVVAAVRNDCSVRWNLSISELPDETMDEFRPHRVINFASDADISIPASVAYSHPDPTRADAKNMPRNWSILINFGPNSFFNRNRAFPLNARKPPRKTIPPAECKFPSLEVRRPAPNIGTTVHAMFQKFRFPMTTHDTLQICIDHNRFRYSVEDI